MRPTLPLLLVGWALLHTCAAWAAGGTAHAVTTTADSGAGSLREAINAANSTPTSDVIGFDAALNGQTIYPLTQLPALVDGGTVIDGDIDNNGDPDIGLDGSQQSSGDGLTFLPHSDGLGCRALGLSVGRFPRYGIYLAGSHLNTIQTCHVGVSLGGAALRTNAHADLYLHQSHDNVIGGDTFAESNIFAGGNGLVSSTAGVYIFEGNNNQIQRNSFGLTRSGTAALGTGREGVIIRNGTGNVVGGGGAAKRSVFGGLKTGISVYFGAHSNSVTGCYVGTTADGYTSLPLTYGVILGADAHDNTVGGTTAAARNIFGGGPDALGVYVLNTGSVDNLICGNYFGLGPNGTTQIDIEDGVYVGSDAGSQTVGGPTEAHGNHFRCPDMGVIVRVGGAGSVIRRNRFGWRADGTAATGVSNARAIEVTDVRVTVSQCSIRGHDVGLRTTGSANPIVTKTTFANCARCVDIQSPSNPNLGNVGNASAADDGGNVFGAGATWQIYNGSTASIRAENNDFGSTSAATINAKIYDQLDNPALGLVDFSPLKGGVIPTGGTEGALALTALSAVPAGLGADIVFTLSAPADVTVDVMNLAGRPVATVVTARPAHAGVERLAWNGLSSHGLRAPRGRYLIRICVADALGERATAVAPLWLD